MVELKVLELAVSTDSARAALQMDGEEFLDEPLSAFAIDLPLGLTHDLSTPSASLPLVTLCVTYPCLARISAILRLFFWMRSASRSVHP